MAVRFKHVVVTLFNLPLWKNDKNNCSTCTDTWLEERFNLFESYCLPSLRAQTISDFIWLVLFDESTPEHFKKRIEFYKTLMPQFSPRYCSPDEAADFHHSDDTRNCRFIRQAIASFLDNSDEFVLTTNVDNDDAIHREMLQTLQAQFVSSPKAALYSLNMGLQYFPHLHVTMRMHYPHNHFLTLAERTDKDFRTIMFYGHTKARKLLPTVDVFGKPYWLEVVHGCNVSNDLRITSRIRYHCFWKSYSLQEYGIPLHFSFRENLMNNLFHLPFYFCKVGAWRLKRKVKNLL